MYVSYMKSFDFQMKLTFSGGSWGNSLVGLVMAPLKATFFCVSRARDRTIYIREIVGVINFRKK